MWFWLNTEHDFNIHSHIFCRQCSNCQFQLSKAKGSPYVLVSKALRWILECQRLWLAASFHVFVGVDSAELPLIKARLFFSCHCCEEQWRWWADPCPSHTVALGKERCLLPFLASERLPHVYGTGFRSRLSTAHIFFCGDLHSHSTVGPESKQAGFIHRATRDQPPHCLICKYKSDLFGHANWAKSQNTWAKSQNHLQLSTAWGEMAAQGSVCSALFPGTNLSQLMTMSPVNAGRTGEENAPSLSIKLLDV